MLSKYIQRLPSALRNVREFFFSSLTSLSRKYVHFDFICFTVWCESAHKL